jgi:hypothetical protein
VGIELVRQFRVNEELQDGEILPIPS